MPTDVRLTFVATGKVELRRTKGPSETDIGAQETKRLHAEAINRMLDRDTGELVGWLYRWNTGALCPRWKTEPREHVIYD